jgi:hypothetical protein
MGAHVKIKAAECTTKHDKREVFIFIDKDHTIYADDVEHVPSKVNFFFASSSSEDCKLFFKNNAVFSEYEHSLKPGSNWLTPTTKFGETDYSTDKPPQSGPKIVVP